LLTADGSSQNFALATHVDLALDGDVTNWQRALDRRIASAVMAMRIMCPEDVGLRPR
jgi:hypothetical protein